MKSRLWSFCLVLWFAVCGVFLAFSGAHAEEAAELGEVIVTATRTPEPVEKIASSVTVITAEELKEQGIESLADALREALGVQILQNGFGGTASISVRGADNGQTVVLIDGVPVYDPSGLGKGDFSWMLPHLSVDQIDRIEIVRGPQSVLYGSNAMAGAINIITKKARRSGGEVYGEYGSYTTFREGLSLYRLTEKTDLAFSFSKKDSKGISKTVSEPDRDAYHNGNLNLSVNHAFSEKVKGGASLLVSAASHELDDTWSGLDKKQNDQLGFIKSYITWKTTEKFKQNFDLAYTTSKRKINEGARGKYKGRLLRLSWQGNYQVNEIAKVIAGLDWQKEWADITSPFGDLDKSAHEWAPFAQLAFAGDKWVANLGLRYTKHETAGSKVTYRVAGAVFPIEAVKIHASYGTGFRTPGLYQLYDPTSGNQDLKPEKSWGYDAGVTFYAWDRKASFDVTYFYNKFK
ncbi:TonB-dependent receptor plug domain-containing protein, partial [Thermodesulfatator indicus]